MPQTITTASPLCMWGRNHNETHDFDYIDWHKLVELIRKPVDLSRLTPKQAKQQCPFILPSDALRKTKDAVQAHDNYTLLIADIDTGDLSLSDVVAKVEALGVESFAIYSTLSHCTTDPEKGYKGRRWRVVIELSESVNTEHWNALQGHLCQSLDGDNCATRNQQIAYAPAIGKAEYEHHIQTGKALDPNDINHSFVGCAIAWDNELKASVAAIEAAKPKAAPTREAKLKEGQISPVTAFNDGHTAEDLLTFYGYRNRGRKWLHPNSASGIPGVVLLNGRYYSHHSQSTDPLADKHTHDAFDLFVAHEHGGDFGGALKAVADSYRTPNGITITQHNQREYMKAKDSAELYGVYGGGEPDIIPLNVSLVPVMPFDYGLLPEALHDWIKDIAERVQCPPDFLAIGAMVGLAGLVGRKVGIHPKQFDDWLVVPNLWGVMIGRPSIMKTPALNEVLRPLNRLIKEAEKEHQERLKDFEISQILGQTALDECKKELQNAGKGKGAEASAKLQLAKANYMEAKQAADENKPPKLKRYIVNDATVEAVGERLNENPNGLILVRDELVGWIKSLDKEDKANDRSFYLECFNGSGAYVYDRIGRGTIKIESTTLSIIGGIQPGKLAPYIANAVGMGGGDDGFIQRFQLAVYPDDTKEWRNVDRFPNTDAKNRAFELYTRLAHMKPRTGLDDFLSIEPSKPETEANMDSWEVMGLRFTSKAQVLFNQWREALEIELRSEDIHPAIESHLAKYRSLIPSLALLLCLADEPEADEVGEKYLQKALMWCDYLKSHMGRVYNGFLSPETLAANRVLKDRNKLPEVFKAKELQQKGWSGLVKMEQTKAALDILIEHGYLIELVEQTQGRPSIRYRWNKNLE